MKSSKTSIWLCGVTIAAALLMTRAYAQTVDLVFEYTAPTTREDGSALPASQIANYELSVVGGGKLADIAPGSGTTYTAQNFALGAEGACFELRTVDTQGNKSQPATTCVAAVPKKPQTFTVRVLRGS